MTNASNLTTWTAAYREQCPASDWRCHECGKLLGVRHGARLHIRLQRHNYLVSLPVEATCHGCGAENLT